MSSVGPVAIYVDSDGQHYETVTTSNTENISWSSKKSFRLSWFPGLEMIYFLNSYILFTYHSSIIQLITLLFLIDFLGHVVSVQIVVIQSDGNMLPLIARLYRNFFTVSYSQH